MTLRVADTLEVRRWILGFGSEAEVLVPASLREALRLEAEALARKLAPQRLPGAQAGPLGVDQRLSGRSVLRPRLVPGRPGDRKKAGE